MIFHAFYTNPNPNPMKNHRSVWWLAETIEAISRED
jgi:hypothetical protein